jgi:hypothetical protein
MTKYFLNIPPVWVQLYTTLKAFWQWYMAIVRAVSPLCPFHLRREADPAIKTLCVSSVGQWTVSRISVTTMHLYKFLLLGTTLKSICVVSSSVLVTFVVWSNLMMLQQFVWYTGFYFPNNRTPWIFVYSFIFYRYLWFCVVWKVKTDINW